MGVVEKLIIVIYGIETRVADKLIGLSSGKSCSETFARTHTHTCFSLNPNGVALPFLLPPKKSAHANHLANVVACQRMEKVCSHCAGPARPCILF